MTTKNRIVNMVIAVLLCICFVTPVFTAYAQNDCHLTVIIKNEQATAYVPDFEVGLCQVAYLQSGVYHLTDAFASSGIALAELSKSNNSVHAAAIVEYINKNNISYATQITQDNGKAVFGNLSRGIYVVFAKKGHSVDFAPFIVFLPQSVNGVNNHYVISTPKTTDKDDGQGGDEQYKSVTVTKIWDDGNDKDSLRPESVTVKLYQNGTLYKKVVLSGSNSWKHTFTNLPVTAAYSVKEDAVSGYTASYSGNEADGFVIVNKHTSGGGFVPPADSYANISVKKLWDDEDNKNNARPASVSVQLIKDGEIFKTAVLNENNGWKYTFGKLSKKSKYTIKEIDVQGYLAQYSGDVNNGFTITNKYEESFVTTVIPIPEYPTEPQKTDITVKKVWNDEGNAKGQRPTSVSVSIIANSSVLETAVLTSEGNWEHTFTDMPVNLSYTVMEDAVSGYAASYSGNAAEGFVITNTCDEDGTSGTPLPPTEPSQPEESPDAEQSGEKPLIPQTGTNVIPAYVIMTLGAILVLIGLVDVYAAEDE